MAYDLNEDVSDGKWTADKQAKRRERRRLRKLGLLSPKRQPSAIHKEHPNYAAIQEKKQEASKRVVSIEFARPEAAALALTYAGAPPNFDPIKFEDLCKQAGLPKPVSLGILRRLKAQFQPVVGQLQRYTTKHFQDKIDEKIGMALDMLDEFSMAGATAKDLAVILGIMLEKRALLRGEPTAILTVEERQNVNSLLYEVMKEATRRGITIDQSDGTEVRAIGGKTNRLLDVPEEILAR